MKKHSVLSTLVIVMMIGLNGIAQADLNDGLVAYYPFNGNANDESGNQNDGVEHGNVSYSAGVIGKAAEFDGIDDYIDPSYNTLSSDSFSLCFWVRTSPGEMDATSMVFGGRTGRTSSIIYVATEFKKKGDNEFFSQLMGFGRGERPELDTDIDLTNNKWHFVAITSSTSSYTLYINGELVATDSQTTSGNLTEEAVIGAFTNICADLPACSSYTEGYFYHGLLDEFRIYNRPLYENEIQELFTKGTSCDSGYTETDLKTARQEGYEAGRQACIDNPTSCGIEINGNDFPSCPGTQNCAAMFDMFTNTLHIPNFQDSYWLDLGLNNWEPVTFELKNMGEIGTK